MRARNSLVLAALACLVVSPVRAQEDATMYVFGEYYVCDQNREAFTDVLTEHVFGPVFDKHVDAGHLSFWGSLGHRAGGEWRRASYYAASDLNTLLDTRDAIYEEAQAEFAAEGREFTDICPSHDDYIWQSVLSSQPMEDLGAARPEAGYSTYYVCETAREARADEIMEEVFAPIFNRQIEAGNFNSWGWLSHVSGGKYRRLMTYDGPDHKTIMAGVAGVLADIQAEASEAGDEFASICGSHSDYMWDILISRP